MAWTKVITTADDSAYKNSNVPNQTISISGQDVTLSNSGGTITIPDLDTQDISLSGNTISLVGGGSLDVSSATAVSANTAKNTNVSTNLGITGSTGARTITSSDGTNAVIPVASAFASGVMSSASFNAVATNTAKTGITTAQASAISANSSKTSYPGTASAGELNLLDGVPVGLTTTEIGYLDGVTSAIQTQINGKESKISASNRVNATEVGTGVVDNTEFNHLNGVTSAIQTQLNGKQASGTYYTDSANATYWQANSARTIGNSGATLTIAGNLDVTGTTTTVNSTNLNVDDKNINIADGASSLANASGAGLSVNHAVAGTVGTKPELQWIDTGTTAQNLTGWCVNGNGDAEHHEIAVMSHSTSNGTGNGAGVGSFHFNTSSDSLWIRTS